MMNRSRSLFLPARYLGVVLCNWDRNIYLPAMLVNLLLVVRNRNLVRAMVDP